MFTLIFGLLALALAFNLLRIALNLIGLIACGVVKAICHVGLAARWVVNALASPAAAPAAPSNVIPFRPRPH